MLVWVGLDQVRIDSKAFTADESGCDACSDAALKLDGRCVAVAEPLVAGT
jgi:hypothetical protein